MLVLGKDQKSAVVVPLNATLESEEQRSKETPDCCYGCGPHSCGLAAILFLWPLEMLCLISVEFLETLIVAFLEIPIQV